MKSVNPFEGNFVALLMLISRVECERKFLMILQTFSLIFSRFSDPLFYFHFENFLRFFLERPTYTRAVLFSVKNEEVSLKYGDRSGE